MIDGRNYVKAVGSREVIMIKGRVEKLPKVFKLTESGSINKQDDKA